MDFTNVKQYLKHFYKIQELRDDFLRRKLKELCEDRLLNRMNASGEGEASLSPGFLQADPPPETAGGSGLVPRKPKNYRPYEEDTCDAEPRYQEEACEASHSEFMDLQKRTTTLYTEKPLIILPTDEFGGASAMFNPEDGTDQYFQIVLPVKDIKIINGMNSRGFTAADGSTQFSDGSAGNEPSNRSLGIGTMEDTFNRNDNEFSYDVFNRRRRGQGYLEISCKSFDINYV